MKRKPVLSAREKRIVETLRRHVPPAKYGQRYRTGSPLCGVFDVLVMLGQRLPYRLAE